MHAIGRDKQLEPLQLVGAGKQILSQCVPMLRVPNYLTAYPLLAFAAVDVPIVADDHRAIWRRAPVIRCTLSRNKLPQSLTDAECFNWLARPGFLLTILFPVTQPSFIDQDQIKTSCRSIAVNQWSVGPEFIEPIKPVENQMLSLLDGRFASAVGLDVIV